MRKTYLLIKALRYIDKMPRRREKGWTLAIILVKMEAGGKLSGGFPNPNTMLICRICLATALSAVCTTRGLCAATTDVPATLPVGPLGVLVAFVVLGAFGALVPVGEAESIEGLAREVIRPACSSPHSHLVSVARSSTGGRCCRSVSALYGHEKSRRKPDSSSMKMFSTL